LLIEVLENLVRFLDFMVGDSTYSVVLRCKIAFVRATADLEFLPPSLSFFLILCLCAYFV
jgi:hypothetical protein